MTLDDIARVCHEANRALTVVLADVPVQPSWDDTPEEMKKSSRLGVAFRLAHPEATSEEQHEEWCRSKIRDGWVRGAMKDAEAKTHPALRPYAELSDGIKSKDAVFSAIVTALSWMAS